MNEKQRAKLDGYLSQLSSWGRKTNLTGSGKDTLLHNKLVDDSLRGWALIKEHVKLPAGEEILDMGAGGGVVSIPISILEEDKRFFLLESNKKKCFILDEIKRELELKNVQILNYRAELAGRKKHLRERFGVIIVKAVSKLQSLVELAFPLLRTGGALLAYKGDRATEELKDANNALRVLSGTVKGVYPYCINKAESTRPCIVHIEKLEATDSNYPRREGMAQRKPIT